MATTKFKGNDVHTQGNLPVVGEKAPAFTLVGQDLAEKTLASFAGKKKVINIFPSIDTGVCATSVRQFNVKAAGKPGVVVVNISADLPFALKRFCAAEGIENVVNLSTFRSPEFGATWGTTMTDGGLKGLHARSVVVVDENDKVVHVELVPEIAQEPNYDAALKAL